MSAYESYNQGKLISVCVAVQASIMTGTAISLGVEGVGKPPVDPILGHSRMSPLRRNSLLHQGNLLHQGAHLLEEVHLHDEDQYHHGTSEGHAGWTEVISPHTMV